VTATSGLAGERTRVSALGKIPDSVDPANVSAHGAGALPVTETAHYVDLTTAAATTTQTNTIKNQNTSSQLHSAASRVSGFLQVVPIETA